MRAILTYHSIDESGSPISVGADVFARHIDWLRSGRVDVMSIADLLADPTGSDGVALTFDDGIANFASEAVPLLRGLPVTLFVVTGHVGGVNNWRGQVMPGIPTLPLLDWQALGRLAEQGVTLGAHTHTHVDLTTLATAEIEDELDGCLAELRARTGAVPEAFAYPYGRVSAGGVHAVSSRFRWACTTDLRTLGPSARASELPRVDMCYFRQPGRLESWGSPAFQSYLAGRRWLRQARGIANRVVARRVRPTVEPRA